MNYERGKLIGIAQYQVELAGFEPASGQDEDRPTTCLVSYSLPRIMRVKKPTTLFRAFENVFKRCE